MTSRPAAKESPSPPRRSRPVVFAAIAVAALGLAGFYLQKAFVRPAPPPLAGFVVDIAADMGGFDKKRIRVKVGEPVTIRLTSLDNQYHSDGGGKHQWAVDELGLNLVARPLSSNSLTFTPAKPGTYTFYCDICCGGRANPTMSGKLIIGV